MRTDRCDIAVTLCMLGSFSKYILFAVFFLQNECFKKILSEILPIDLVLKSLDSDQAQQFVGPDLGANCLQRLSAVGTGR